MSTIIQKKTIMSNISKKTDSLLCTLGYIVYALLKIKTLVSRCPAADTLKSVIILEFESHLVPKYFLRFKFTTA